MTVRFLKHSIKSDLTYSSGLNMGIKLILGTSLLLRGLSSLEIPMSNANWPSLGAAPEPNSSLDPGYIKHISLSTAENNSLANNQGDQVLASNGSVTVKQETFMSEPAPVRHLGQPPHEVVFALPLRDDGKVWSGRATFTASKPIEVEVLHMYNPNSKIDQIHGEPYHATLPGNKTITISHLRDVVDVPIEINGTGMSSGTFEFIGNALVFHKTTGEPFTVTYTIEAQVKSLKE